MKTKMKNFAVTFVKMKKRNEADEDEDEDELKRFYNGFERITFKSKKCTMYVEIEQFLKKEKY